MCRAPWVSPYLTYKSCWRLNLGWGSAWRCVCLADDGVEKWIAASLSFKCTYSRAPACGSGWGLQPRFTLNTVTWGHLAGFQGFSLFILHKNIFDVYFFSSTSRADASYLLWYTGIWNIRNLIWDYVKLDFFGGENRTCSDPSYQRYHRMCSHRMCSLTHHRAPEVFTVFV